MEFNFKIYSVFTLLLSILVSSTVCAQSPTIKDLDVTFYKYDTAWIDVSGEGHKVATLNIRHFHINTQAQRLISIPILLTLNEKQRLTTHSEFLFNFMRVKSLEGYKLAEIFENASRFADLKLIVPRAIDLGDECVAYVIYSDRETVEIINLQSVLDIKM